MKTSNHLFKISQKDCSAVQRGGGSGGESRQLYSVGAGKSSASTTADKNTSSAARLPQSGRLQKYGNKKIVETRSKFVIFLHVRRSYLRFVTWFMSILKFGLPRLSSEVLQTKRKTELFRAIPDSSKSKIKNNGFEFLLSMQTCQRNQVLNYASKTVWALSSYDEPSQYY